jgi:hypothetical protein
MWWGSSLDDLGLLVISMSFLKNRKNVMWEAWILNTFSDQIGKTGLKLLRIWLSNEKEFIKQSSY